MRKLLFLFLTLASISLLLAQNLVSNPGFESWTETSPDGWLGSKSNIGTDKVFQYETSVHSGLFSCQLINTSNSHKRFTNQPTTVEGGVEYMISFWVRGAGEIRTALYDGISGQYGYTDYNPYITVNSTEWTQYSQYVTAGGDTDSAQFIFSIRNTVADNDHLQIDDVEITATAAPSVMANFAAQETSVFIGNPVQFTDMSTGEITSWNWFFEGGNPETSTLQNPSVTYNTPGVYDVKLIVSDGTMEDSLLRENYITVTEEYITIFNQNWNEQQWNGWQQISVTGDQIWEITQNYGINNTPCIKMSGYAGAANENEDWLISPAFNLNEYNNVILTFQNAFNYNGNALEVFFSNNFDGNNVATALWQPLTFTASSGNWAWTPSGAIALDAFEGDNCVIAFKYTSTSTAASTWEIDDILLVATEEVPQTLEAQFTASTTTITEGEQVTFTNTSTGTISEYAWTFEGGEPATSTEENPTVTYSTAGIYDVQLVVTDGTNFDTLLITDYILVNVAGEIICNNGFEVWTEGLPNCWVGSKTNIGTENIVQYTENPYMGSSACQLINTGSSHKRFTNQPTTVEGGVEYMISFWVRGAGEIRTALYDGISGQYGYTDYNPYITVNSTEWTQHSQYITAGGDTDSAQFIFSVRNTVADNSHLQIDEVEIVEHIEPLAADFSGTPTTIQEGETVTFTDVSTGNPTGWNWIFEGGTPETSQEQNPTVTYSISGTYDVTLTVTDGTNDSTKTITDYITVTAAPVGPTASFTASTTTITEGEQVTFTNTSTGTISEYAWTFEGGEPATSTEENPTVTYSTAGIYDVQLIVTDGTNFDTLLITDYILVNVAGEIICNNGFEAWTEGLPNCWVGSKTNIGTENIVQYTENPYMGSSACQLINTGSSHKRFTNQPTTVEGGVEYMISFWVRGAGEIRTGLYDGISGQYGYTDYNPYITVNSTEWTQHSQYVTAGGDTDSAQFIFSVRNTGANNSHLQIDEVEITASTQPTLTANFEANATYIPEGTTVQFTDLSLGSPTSWSWTFEGGTPETSQEQNPTVTYSISGTYDVTLTISNGTQTDTKTIENYITVIGGTIIFNQNWNDQQWNGWSQVSITGEQTWNIIPNYGIDNTPCVKMSGYDNGAFENEDWLISPAFNLNDYNNVALSFQNAFKYDGNPLEVLFSNNYDGQNPLAATWSPLSFIASSGNFAWTHSGEISLDNFDGTNCYIAFKYTCNNVAASTWEVDDILLVASSSSTLTANFYAMPSTIFVGETTVFIDASTGNPTSWSWIFEGGTPETSTDQAPVVTYNTAGTFDVTLTVSNGESSDTKTISDCITVLPILVDPKLVITEIMYNPPESGTDSLEFIEILNNDDEAINLLRFKLTTAVNFTFPEILLQPGEYVVIAGNPTAILNTFGIQAYQWSGSLNNVGEEIVLENPIGTIVDAVTYSKELPWYPQANGEGYSLDLENPNSDNSLAENWALSTGFAGTNSNGDTLWATPGAPFGYFFPLVDFAASETIIPIGTTINFTNLTQDCNATSFVWTFEGGNPTSSNEENPSVSYNEFGQFDVTLTVSNEHGTTSLTKPDYIQMMNSVCEISNIAVKCYPNPTQKTMIIETELQNVTAILFDMNGKNLLQTTFNRHHQIDVSSFKSGTYFLKIISEDQKSQSIIKIIKIE